MTELSPSERTRLQKLVGMLASDFDGERANAARMITRFASERKVTIVELLMGDPVTKPRWPKGILDGLSFSLRFCEVLNEWEERFARDVPQRYADDDDLSERQESIALRIIEKVRTYAIETGEVGG